MAENGKTYSNAVNPRLARDFVRNPLTSYVPYVGAMDCVPENFVDNPRYDSFTVLTPYSRPHKMGAEEFHALVEEMKRFGWRWLTAQNVLWFMRKKEKCPFPDGRGEVSVNDLNELLGKDWRLF